MSACRWHCWGPWGSGASHLYTEPGTVGGHPAELRVRRGEKRGGQDARSRVRPSLTSSEGTGGGGAAGVKPGSGVAPGMPGLGMGVVTWGNCSGLPPLRLGCSQSVGCQTRFRGLLPVNAPFGPYFCTRGKKRLLRWGPLAANLLLARFPYSASFLSAQLEAGPSVQPCQRGR